MIRRDTSGRWFVKGPALYSEAIMTRSLFIVVALVFCATGAGCGRPESGPTVIFLDGAGWYASSGGVESGLRQAGYTGRFETFSWSAFLGPAHDHFVNANSRGVGRRLARRIEAQRKLDPESSIHLMGLSAGTAVVLRALEELPKNVQVDSVVLFSASVSSQHNLTRAMAHVKGRLYATASTHDAILAGLPANADGHGGAPAGRVGFRLPTAASAQTVEAYNRVVVLPWQPSYLGFGWTGSHTSVTDGRFVGTVIAPRILSPAPFPLDRSVVSRAEMRTASPPS